MVWYWLPIVVVIALAATELIRRSPFIVSVFAFVLVPIGLAFLWPHLGLEPTGFEYIKVGSTAFGSIFISCLRYLNWVRFSWARLVGFLILFINVAEAMFTESLSNMYVNVAAGGLLLLSQAFPRFIRTDAEANLRYDLGLDWVLAYTLWNFTFVYGTAPPNEPVGEWAAFALAHLIVPLLLMGGNPALYIQVRAYSLTLFMMLAVTLPNPPYLVFVPNWHNPLVANILRFASLAFAVFVLLRSVKPAREDGPPRTIAGAIVRAIAGLLRR